MDKFVKAELLNVAQIVTENIEKILKSKSHSLEDGLIDAIAYSSLSGGKMIRSYMTYSFCNILDISKTTFLNIATAVELLHCYSLIHDDLPAMDDDDIRRGRASCHKKYDDATAILAGDALQALAFEVLSDITTCKNSLNLIELIKRFAQDIGCKGMVGGQYLDLYMDKNSSIEKIIHMQKLKTGKLIEFSCIAPIILYPPVLEKKRAVMNYAHDIGVAYQIKDDLLDVLGDEQKMGKKVGKDKDKNKKTLIEYLGVEKSMQQLELLTTQAKNHLNTFGDSASNLRIFTEFLLNREK